MFWATKKGWFGKQLEDNIEALENGDISSIPRIFCVFSEKHRKSKYIASKALSKALQHMTFDDVIRIDQQMRQTTSMEWFIDWHKLKIESFFTTDMSQDERCAVAVFASFNPNGYIREQAVHIMIVYKGTLPYIILRQNDWVMQVRQVANKAFDERISNLSKGEMFVSLPFIEKLRFGKRGLHRDYSNKFSEKLCSPECKDDLLKGLQNQNIRIRRTCIYALLDSKRMDTPIILNHLTCEQEPFIRRIIFEKLLKLGENLREVSYTFLTDKYPCNRILALQYLCDSDDTNLLDISMACLLDKNAGVRELARAILLSLAPEFSFRTFYIDKLDTSTAVAILGISETGEEKDAHLIERFLFDSQIAVVKATMIAMMNLSTEKYKEEIIKKLDHPCAGIVKTACRLIIKYRTTDFHVIHDILRHTQFEHSKVKSASILFTAPKWDSILYMLEIISCNDDKIYELTIDAMQRWLLNFNKSFALPSEQQKNDIRILLYKQKERIPTKLEQELLFTVR